MDKILELTLETNQNKNFYGNGGHDMEWGFKANESNYPFRKKLQLRMLIKVSKMSEIYIDNI